MSSSITLRAPAHQPPWLLDPTCASCTPPERDPATFAMSSHWKVVLHPDQTVPGALLVVALRHVAKVGELTPDEWVELHALYRSVERMLERVLGAAMVNLSCLRNWAYRAGDPDPPHVDGQPNPHVHWHVAPRYDRTVTIAGSTFVDVDFGGELRWRGRRLDDGQTAALIGLLADGLGVVGIRRQR